MFSHISEIVVLIFLGYAILYPAFLWIAPRRLIDGGFYRFNLGKVAVVGSLGVMFFHLQNPPLMPLIYVYVWEGLVLGLTALYWRSNKISNLILSFITAFGLLVLYRILPLLSDIQPLAKVWFSVGLSHALLAAIFFAMILGHWYLNVVQLPIQLLKKATGAFWGLLWLRIFWIIFILSTTSFVDGYGIEQNLLSFLGSFNGFLLNVALFLGLVVPFLLNMFVWRTLKLHATQSATGLLYVSSVSILFGDLLFKYYFFQYGIPL